MAADGQPTIGGTYSYSNARYDGEPPPEAQGGGPQQPYAPQGPDIPCTAGLHAERTEGAHRRRAPAKGAVHKATAWAEYTQNLGNNGRVVYLTSINWTDKFPAAGRPCATAR